MVKQGENYSIVGNPIKIMKNNATIAKTIYTMAKLEQDNRKIVKQWKSYQHSGQLLIKPSGIKP